MSNERHSLNPLDGHYATVTSPLRDRFSGLGADRLRLLRERLVRTSLLDTVPWLRFGLAKGIAEETLR